MNDRVILDEVTTVRTVVTIGPIYDKPLGTFGWFVGVRSRYGRRPETRDRQKYGTCIICRRNFDDDTQIHIVFSVKRNGTTIGNRLCCGFCAEQYATHHRRTTVDGAQC